MRVGEAGVGKVHATEAEAGAGTLRKTGEGFCERQAKLTISEDCLQQSQTHHQEKLTPKSPQTSLLRVGVP